MADQIDRDALKQRVDGWVDALASQPDPGDVDAARAMLAELLEQRQYKLAARLAEALVRHDPFGYTVRRQYAQALIELGLVTVAVDALKVLHAELKAQPQWADEAAKVCGLLGRAHKQLFVEQRDRRSVAAEVALKDAIRFYRSPFERDTQQAWHGINLLALAHNAQQHGINVGKLPDMQQLADQLLGVLQQTPAPQRDPWFLASLAEVHLGGIFAQRAGDRLRQLAARRRSPIARAVASAVADALPDPQTRVDQAWAEVEQALQQYVLDARVTPFMVASTLRQFRDVWGLAQDARGRGLLQILQARLMSMQQGGGEVSVGELDQALRQPPPTGQLEAVLGSLGTKTWEWWQDGLAAARSVCAIQKRGGNRFGTGWALRAANLGPSIAEQAGGGDVLIVITNFHVVNSGLREADYTPGAALPDEVELCFEAVATDRRYRVRKVLWESPPGQHDCAVLLPDEPLDSAVRPLALASALPGLEGEQARVFVIGHPLGQKLAFSMQDNELIDHEGPPNGQPAIPGVCRVHYRAPTQPGNSGSPVFNSQTWEVIALHHKGGAKGMRLLNGKPGTYGANEGITMASIISAIAAGGPA